MFELLASGRTADVYDIGDGRVLRRYRDGFDVAAEAAVMEHVRAQGFPAPAVFRANGPDLEMERLTGPTMLRSLLDGDTDSDAVAAVLADLHRRLHELPPAPRAATGAVVIHLDLHPDNVIMTPAGPVLIDWCNATNGPPDLDVALSALILAQVAVDPTSELAGPADDLLTAFLARADGAPARMLARAAARRGADPTQSPAEIEQLGRATEHVAARCRDR